MHGFKNTRQLKRSSNFLIIINDPNPLIKEHGALFSPPLFKDAL